MKEKIEQLSRRLGFDLVGVLRLASAGRPTTLEHYLAWLRAGHHGQMAYLARPDAVNKRGDMAHILPGIQSAVVVGVNYHTRPLPPGMVEDPSRGIVASYAWGDDYHDLLLPRLRQLAELVARELGQPVAYRAYVDTGPLLERELGARAGLGFVGKNTNLIHPRLGSWLLLGELLLTIPAAQDDADKQPSSGERPPDSPVAGSCGRCTRCLDACPTGALVAPYVLDARRCISYLTVELKGPIARDLRPLMGNRIFGCDICQEVCPWNRKFARATAEAGFQPRPDGMAPPLLDLIALDEDGFRRRFRGSPVKRAKRRGLLRNVAVALGNWGHPAAVPALVRALQDAEPLIRGHAAWALGRIAAGLQHQPSEEAGAKRVTIAALEQALTSGRQAVEADPWVREELDQALAKAREIPSAE
jgi:epoxyqueuosine reductase